MTPQTHRRAICLLIAAATIPIGLAWRFVPLGLPPFLYKYGGSAFWAIMVYWLIAATLPRRTPIQIAAIAGTVATMVELTRLIHTPASDAFRITLAGKILLGRFFSGWDIVAYWLAIVATALADAVVRPRTR